MQMWLQLHTTNSFPQALFSQKMSVMLFSEVQLVAYLFKLHVILTMDGTCLDVNFT